MRIYFATKMTNPFRRMTQAEIIVADHLAELREIREGLTRIRSTYEEFAEIERIIKSA